ncbi:3-hydroxybutyryl-CoA dehydrogenase [Burkholderia sp. SRS-W-2-2016]|uniref:3-hydroxybutyryl-CoA dehydrogenase n=1 Tax=Burkholderia sp. SRS-W-2-2016 TaxID=1926878 RepID=UPI00094ACE7E|nr:3-hydroxybutyryl-CoA dehydrogenase [Burkholderia sp. SRS-W-2-2016]OLL31462.1 3-hydroxybutyryl-CoA dehydrogenase [Burkholderia sp. SRS-W-2-2016]
MTTRAVQPNHVHVLGAGRMGQGIALAFAFAGLRVTLIDFKPRDDAARAAFAKNALGEIERQLRSLVEFGRLDAAQAADTLARVEVVDRAGAEAGLVNCEVVFEAVPEVMDAKREAFAWLCARVGSTATIASTTSTFLVTDLHELVTQPQRFINAHWLNPAHLMPLVEISRSEITDPAVVARLKELLRRAGKAPVECAPAAGYIVPRLQALVMNEAARMVEEGVASAEDIDTAVRTGFGLRFSVLGLLEFIDWGGCDILFYASRYLAGEIGPRFEPAAIVSQNMEQGRDGIRTGEGFYDYAGVDVPAYVKRRLGEFGGLLDHLELAPRYQSALAHGDATPCCSAASATNASSSR